MPNMSAHDRYDQKNTIRYSLKLNIKTDEDIIKAIDPNNKQTSIKKLIRLGLTKNKL